jgi:hypothetical protein
MPVEQMNGSWSHPARLPLGAGWNGQCAASAAHVPSDDELRDHCNLGYAKCEHLPESREADAVRFAVASASDGRIIVRYACEHQHRPADCGTLEFDSHRMEWTARHANQALQRMANCYVNAYLSRIAKS